MSKIYFLFLDHKMLINNNLFCFIASFTTVKKANSFSLKIIIINITPFAKRRSSIWRQSYKINFALKVIILVFTYLRKLYLFLNITVK